MTTSDSATFWVAVNPYYSSRKLGTYPTEALAWAAVNRLTEAQHQKYVAPGGRGQLTVMTTSQFNKIVGMLQASADEDEAEEIIYWVLRGS